MFDMEFMRINYTNPLLSKDEVKSHMQDYFEKTRPQRFKEDIENSTVF